MDRYLVSITALLIAGSAVASGAQAENELSWDWLFFKAIEQASSSMKDFPRDDVERCVVSYKAASHDVSKAMAGMPVDLSQPATVVYSVGQGFESTTVTVVGSNKAGVPIVAFDDLTAQEHHVLTPAEASELEKLARVMLSGKPGSFSGVQDGECLLVVRKEGSRLFPPGYGIVDGKNDALRLFMAAIDDALGASVGQER